MASVESVSIEAVVGGGGLVLAAAALVWSSRRRFVRNLEREAGRVMGALLRWTEAEEQRHATLLQQRGRLDAIAHQLSEAVPPVEAAIATVRDDLAVVREPFQEILTLERDIATRLGEIRQSLDGLVEALAGLRATPLAKGAPEDDSVPLSELIRKVFTERIRKE